MPTINEYLKGCHLIVEGERVAIQSIGNLTLAFLTTDPEFSHDELFVNPLDLKFSNTNYGNLTIQNSSGEGIAIVPQIAVFARQAQNHAMTKSVMLDRANKTYHDAACVEGSTVGLIARDGVQDVRFLPVAIREAVLNTAGKGGRGFDRLYDIIEAMGRKTGAQSGHYLDKFFSSHGTELNTYLAHFERPPRCIGVVVLLDEEIVALDKFPSFRYTNQVWDVLIRDCYGILALPAFSEGNKGIDLEKYGNDAQASNPLQAVSLCVRSYTEHIEDKVISLLGMMESEAFAEKPDNDSQTTFVESGNFKGQVISSGDYYHYVTLIRKEAFDKARRKAREVNDRYNELAAKQRQFRVT